MSLLNKIIWSEGMFLHPHHFQQQDRYFEHLIVARSAMLDVNLWGITELTIDRSLFSIGKFSLRSCSGILPDGTPFSIPDRDAVPAPIDIPAGLSNSRVYLALAVERPGIAMVSPEAEAVAARQENNPLVKSKKQAKQSDCLAATHMENEMLYRYQIDTVEMKDHNAGSELLVAVQQGRLALRLLREDEDRQGFSCLPLAMIAESKEDHSITLNDHYFTTCLNVHASAILVSFLKELISLVDYRGHALTQRLTQSNNGGVAEIADFMLLQIMNRFEPLLQHFLNVKNLHPQQLYIALIQLSGELATFTAAERRPLKVPPYIHEDLYGTFKQIISDVRNALNVVLEENAVSLVIEEQETNLWVSSITDKTLLDKSTFVLAVHANIPAETIRNEFPSHAKVAPVEEIRNLVNRALPGIDVTVLSVAPRQIPYHANFTYFSLSHQHGLWQSLKKSAGLAFHIGGSFPGLRLELWAIKEKRYE